MPDLPSDRPPALSELNAAGLTSTQQTIRSEPFMGDAA
jgi:hypothetical protein